MHRRTQAQLARHLLAVCDSVVHRLLHSCCQPVASIAPAEANFVLEADAP